MEGLGYPLNSVYWDDDSHFHVDPEGRIWIPDGAQWSADGHPVNRRQILDKAAAMPPPYRLTDLLRANGLACDVGESHGVKNTGHLRDFMLYSYGRYDHVHPADESVGSYRPPGLSSIDYLPEHLRLLTNND
ncbi:hypothetical protein H257_07052 [Aphanomyces astaci]|uniref:Uncharacterized protein n=1 Tax=Aphanomyces astaci TaxID=112090 RepID=W4GKF6_APHAT|nr:hypothetical protein H257_07052 [Aphanomyces astaci]ETV79836.1 hypothetical protein H257_07052 [Aphanomyces astaci]|eukprot:XP_009830772.1 hypothetical protein H257_07052 [Aphanomyces astaci]